jgi:hypothetical protein
LRYLKFACRRTSIDVVEVASIFSTEPHNYCRLTAVVVKYHPVADCRRSGKFPYVGVSALQVRETPTRSGVMEGAVGDPDDW